MESKRFGTYVNEIKTNLKKTINPPHRHHPQKD